MKKIAAPAVLQDVESDSDEDADWSDCWYRVETSLPLPHDDSMFKALTAPSRRLPMSPNAHHLGLTAAADALNANEQGMIQGAEATPA